MSMSVVVIVVNVDAKTSQEEVRGGLDAMVRALRDVDPLDSRLSFRELLLLNTTNNQRISPPTSPPPHHTGTGHII